MNRPNPQRAGACANCYEESDWLFDAPIYAANYADIRCAGHGMAWWKYPGMVGPADLCTIVEQDEEIGSIYLRWYDVPEAPICWDCYGQNASVCGVRFLCNKPPQIVLHGWQKPTWEESE